MSHYVCVTGAAGFIGRHVVAKLCARGDRVYAVDAMTYAADPEAFAALQARYPDHLQLRPVDVRSLGRLPDVNAVIHLAASTHVDNSFSEAEEFVANNVGSTAKILELVRAKSQHGAPHLVHISTDEVYGPILTGAALEFTPLAPTSPYAASKAAADLLVQAWNKTYGLNAAILRLTNCYGVGQYPEKLIPKAVRCLMLGKPIPIHGDGTQTRQWLAVEDAADAILLALDKRLWGVFNVGGNTEASVNAVVGGIAHLWPADGHGQSGFVRPAGDLRYAVDDTAIHAEGWAPVGDFWADLPTLVDAERTRWRW